MFEKILVLHFILFLALSLNSQNSDNKLVEKLVEKGVLSKEEAKDIISDMAEEDDKKISTKDWESIKSLVNNKYLQLGGVLATFIHL